MLEIWTKSKQHHECYLEYLLFMKANDILSFKTSFALS